MIEIKLNKGWLTSPDHASVFSQVCLLEPAPELAASLWGRCTFHHTDWGPALPLQILGAGEAENPGVSLGCSLTFLLQLIPWDKACTLSRKKAYQEINFF